MIRQRMEMFRAAWMTIRRAGMRRGLHRVERRVRLRFVNPYLARRLYRVSGQPDYSATPPLVRATLNFLSALRRSPGEPAWDGQQVRLIGQASFPLVPPVDWQARPINDLLWNFQLHGWDWAWPALGEPQHGNALLALQRDWLANVPTGRGPAWEPYPTSRRLIVWCAAWHLLGGDATLLAAIGQHASYLADNLEFDLDNNHLVANAKALAWAGLLAPQLSQADTWRTQGLDLLWRTIDAQVRADGGHSENSTGYHLAVWLDGLETAYLCKALGEPLPPAVLACLERMGDFALGLRRPDGRLPLLNDSITDEPLPLERLFLLATRLIARPDFAWAAGLPYGQPPAPRSVAFPGSGYAVLRAGALERGLYLLFDAGDLGPRHCPGHGHADALSIELWAAGEPIVLDPGTYQYPAGEWRDYFRSTAAHSTATIDGNNQSVFAGPFRVADMAHAQLTSFIPSAHPEVTGQHDGYLRLASPVLHRRRVILVNEQTVVIEDEFAGNGRHSITVRLRLAPATTRRTSTTAVSASFPGGTQLACTFSGMPGTASIEEGWLSDKWYQRQAAPVIVFRSDAQSPVQLRTTLRISPMPSSR